jgi:hypothetical protein
LLLTHSLTHSLTLLLAIQGSKWVPRCSSVHREHLNHLRHLH